jgi:signal transduction histidine kinase
MRGARGAASWEGPPAAEFPASDLPPVSLFFAEWLCSVGLSGNISHALGKFRAVCIEHRGWPAPRVYRSELSSTGFMAERVPFPPPGFDELSVDEKINYLQSLRDRIAATPETVRHLDSLGERLKDPQADSNDRERLRRLITAQEEERASIARELHDDIGQRLAVLGIELARAAEDSPGSLGVSGRVIELQRQVSEIARDVQSLSQELHSSTLALLGIGHSAKFFCEEFSDRQKVRIDCEIDDQARYLPPTVSLTLYRVLQEALHNSVKHGATLHCDVRLWKADGWIHLVVEDHGAGFDVEAAKRGHGIGLISMEERIKMVDGVLTIKSQPQHGTSIYARVPLTQVDADDVS